ncbi:MAG: ATP-binding protein, partial [Candidatus Wallbacteria bacterium]
LNEVTGMPVKIFYDEKYYNEYGDIFRKKTFELGHYESEVVQKKKNGSTFATWFSATILKNANGEYSGMVGIARDITERKKYEEEALKETKLESLGILAGGIAHDFNNVLMGIIGNITLAKKRTVNDEKTYEILKRAEKVAYKAQNLTRQLITFSKGGLLLKSLNSLNEIVSGTAHFTLTGSNITLKLSLAKDLKNAYIDEGQITQVITNIILNAKQAISENPQNSNGTIEIKTENKIFAADNSLGLEPGNYIQLQIKDNGPGISPENLSKIFDPYFTTKPAGSGLGLSTTYSIIKGHNGAITAKSELNKETYFDIYIPAANESNISPPAEISAEHKSDNKRLLIMDDDETVLIPLYEMLTDSGYAVKLARNGDEAVLLYTQSLKEGQKFDAVILDLIIKGGLGGVETIKKILELDREAAAIVSSGYSDDPVMAEYKKYGFKGFLAKPYHSHEIEELLARIIKKEQ